VWLSGALHHHFRCNLWDADDSENAFKMWKSYLGTARTPYDKWVRSFSPYTWPLWRNWKPPKRAKVETPAEVNARLSRVKPCDYTWKLWFDHARRVA